MDRPKGRVIHRSGKLAAAKSQRDCGRPFFNIVPESGTFSWKTAVGKKSRVEGAVRYSAARPKLSRPGGRGARNHCARTPEVPVRPSVRPIYR